MKKEKVSQEEWDKLIKHVEENTCFRYSAGTDANTVFMIPVGRDNRPMGIPIEFTLKKLQALAKIKRPKSLTDKG